MILYQLQCADEHSFEAWFRNSASFDEQAVSGDVECPYCGSTNVSKALMAPHIASTKGDEGTQEDSPQEDQTQEDSPQENRALPETDINAMDERRAQEVAQQILDAVGRIHDYTEEHCENVGDEFASEVRKIHYGDAEERDIYGKASEKDAEDLTEEGIDFMRIPGLPRRNN